MMSAQNPLLPLNGSKIALLAFLVIFIASCSTISRSSTVINTHPSPEDISGNEEAIEAPKTVDTVLWTLVSETEMPPITSDMKKEGFGTPVFKETYEVALLIPFRSTGTYNQMGLDANQKKFAHFYAGMKQAIEEKHRGQPKINITTYDTNRSPDQFEKIMNRMRRYKPDIIIGPYETELISEAAEFARSNEIPLISPWRASTRVTSDNLFYLQLRPNITEYYKKIVRHINYHFSGSEVRIIGRDTGQDKSKIQAIQRINEEESNLPVVEQFEGFMVNEDSLLMADSLIFDDVFEEEASVFILPNFSSRDEAFLYSCLRKLYAEKGDREIYIYAMPLALNSERIDLNIRKNLNIRICEYRFANMLDPKIQRLRQKYFDSFGWLPNEDSFFGYDVMQLVLHGLQKHGQYFHYYLAGEKVDLNQMSVFIEPFSRDDSDRTDYMMNSHLYLIEFDEDHFVVRDIN